MAPKVDKAGAGVGASNAKPDYILFVQLTGTTSPTISRVLTIPASSTFHLLHLALQLAFGWVCVHVYEFEVIKLSSSTIQDPAIARGIFDPKDVKVTIQEEEPEHLDFSMFPGMRQTPRVAFKQSKTTKISDIFEDTAVMAGSSVEYKYDFGDHWIHTISLVGRALTTGTKPTCLSGEGHGAAEDAGGECYVLSFLTSRIRSEDCQD